MKLFIKAVLILILFAPRLLSAQVRSEYADSIMQIKGKWDKSVNYLTDAGREMPKSQQPSALKITEGIARLLKKVYPVPKGMNARWHTSIRGTPSIPDAPFPYTVDLYLFYYYYNTAYKKIIPVDETGTLVHIEVNYPSYMLKPYSYSGASQYVEAGGQLHMVRELWPEDGSWKGYTMYKGPYKEAKSDYTRSIVITRGKEPLWLPVTQLQFLQMRRKLEEKELSKVISDYEKADSGMRAMIVSIKKMNIDAASKEKMIARQNEILEDRKKKREQTIKTNTGLWTKRIKVIDDYIAKNTAETLQQQAILSKGDFIEFGFGKPDDIIARRLVVINPAYFNYKLPRYEPQFIVVRWSIQMLQEPAVYFKQQFEANFDVEKLKAMLK